MIEMSNLTRQEILSAVANCDKIILTKETIAYLKSHQTKKVTVKVIRNIKLLNEFGLNLPDQYIHRIWGSKENLWELRIIFAGQQERVLFFTLVESKFLLTNGFQKTTDRVPQSEITSAEKIYYEYLRRKKEEDEKQGKKGDNLR